MLTVSKSRKPLTIISQQLTCYADLKTIKKDKTDEIEVTESENLVQIQNIN